MKGQFEHGSIYDTAKLYECQLQNWCLFEPTYESINEDQNSCLCMLSTLHVSVDSNSPSLISSSFPTGILSICENEFRSEKEDVDSTESCNGINVFNDGYL